MVKLQPQLDTALRHFRNILVLDIGHGIAQVLQRVLQHFGADGLHQKCAGFGAVAVKRVFGIGGNINDIRMRIFG